MICKYCNVNVKSSTTVCPLCHNLLNGTPESQPNFPPRKIRKFKAPISFSGVYFFVALSIIITCAIINACFPTKISWAKIVLVFLIYLYFLIRNTILYKGSGGSKIYTQTLSLSLMAICLQYITHTKEWAYSYAMPIISIVSLLIFILFISIFNKKTHQYVRYMALTAFIGMIPSVLYMLNVIKAPYLAFISLVLSAIILIGLIVFSRKTLCSEFEKKGHF